MRIRSVHITFLSALIVLVLAHHALAVFGIQVTSDLAGKTFAVGNTMSIQWDADQFVMAAVIEVSADNGKTWALIQEEEAITPTHASWRNYSWVVKAQVSSDEGGQMNTISDSCLARVRDYDDGTVNGVSGSFRIVAVADDPTREPPEESSDSGCGKGAGIAFIPPIAIRAWRGRRGTGARRS